MRHVLFAALALLGGCALTSKAKPVEVAWYTPERVHAAAASPATEPGPPVRLGRVSSGLDLGRRIAWGDGAYEAGYYEARRWTERPEDYVRSALDRTLFQDQRFQRALAGAAPTVDVDVEAFQELRTPAKHAARIALHVVAATDRVLLEDTIAVEEPVGGPAFDDVVAAMSRALDAASLEVAARLGAALSRPPQEHGAGRE